MRRLKRFTGNISVAFMLSVSGFSLTAPGLKM